MDFNDTPEETKFRKESRNKIIPTLIVVSDRLPILLFTMHAVA